MLNNFPNFCEDIRRPTLYSSVINTHILLNEIKSIFKLPNYLLGLRSIVDWWCKNIITLNSLNKIWFLNCIQQRTTFYELNFITYFCCTLFILITYTHAKVAGQAAKRELLRIWRRMAHWFLLCLKTKNSYILLTNVFKNNILCEVKYSNSVHFICNCTTVLSSLP